MDTKKYVTKYKNLKYQHLKKIYHQKLRCSPTNCKYNKEILLPNRSKINICSFDLDSNFEVDLCYKPEHANFCNAFCPKKTKEKLHEEFLMEIKDPKVRSTKYKDINTLFWVYPELESEDFIKKNTKVSTFWNWVKSLF